MNFNLPPGELVQIVDAITLIVLSVEADLIRFGLETLEGESPGADDMDNGYDEADPNRKWNSWELN